MANRQVTSPILFTKSMPDPRDSQYVDTPEALEYAIHVLTSMRNKYLSVTTLLLLEDERIIDNVVTLVASNLCTSRPTDLISIINSLSCNVLSSNASCSQKQQQLINIIQRACLTSVLWTYRQRTPFISGEVEYLSQTLGNQVPTDFSQWLMNVDPTANVLPFNGMEPNKNLKLEGNIGNVLFKLIVADKARLILQAPANLDNRQITTLNQLLSKLNDNEWRDLATRTPMNVEGWKSVAQPGSTLARFLQRAISYETSPFDANYPNSV